MNENEFIGSLNPEGQALYRRDLRQIVGDIKRRHRDEYHLNYDRLVNEISIHQSHDDLMNICIYPFEEERMEPRKMGYIFERTDPLIEMIDENTGARPPNFDLLIIRKTGKRPILIFIEAKSQITDFGRELKDIDKKIQIVEANLDYIKNSYLKLRSDPIREYVVAVAKCLSNDIVYYVDKAKKDFIVWEVETFNPNIRMAKPRGEKGIGRTHLDSDLSSLLGRRDGIRSVKNVYSVFPESHAFAKLALLLEARVPSRNPSLVIADLLRKKVGIYFGKMSEHYRTDLVDYVITEAQRIGFIEPVENLAGAFRIKSKSRSADSLTPELQRAWVKKQLEDRRDSDIRQAIEALQTRHLERQRGIPTLFTFDTTHQPEPPFH